ncbi:hypothetical protein QT970_28555 [Microcoleus sp. herbarium8]|uniref:hypothetical protein n=1 Tax=Microcoleus sp. herbarium8 TaxID=3055436 RepID=UPI002FD00E61
MISLTQGDVKNILFLFLASIGSVYFLKNPKAPKINFSNFKKDPNTLDDSVNPEQDSDQDNHSLKILELAENVLDDSVDQKENSDQENSSSEILEVAEKQKINTTSQSDQEISKISLETTLKEALPVFLSLLVIYLLYKYFSAYPLTDFLFSL